MPAAALLLGLAAVTVGERETSNEADERAHLVADSPTAVLADMPEQTAHVEGEKRVIETGDSDGIVPPLLDKPSQVKSP